MLLKYLDIHGFKSFPDKTRIEFGRGITAVVGPNGSGKSNISDALRWVMGEQSTKTLRGAKMEDIIFSGTKTRKSQGFTQVSLTIDNKDRLLNIDSDDVVITRKYDRNFDSEYRINGALVRLKDINELLMDTGLGKDGYAIISQGKISDIIQSKSGERREIFEEAAGISKYRYRKNESEKNLANAEENLIRLKDILSELENRLEPLKIQSEKANQFISLSEKKKILEVSLWVDIINNSANKLKDISDKLLIAKKNGEEIEEETLKLEQLIQNTFDEMKNCLVFIESIRTKKTNIEDLISAKKSEIAVCENDILHTNNNKSRIEKEIILHNTDTQKIKNELIIKNKEQENITIKIENIKIEISEKEKQLNGLTNKSNLFSEEEYTLNSKYNEILILQSSIKANIDQKEIIINENKYYLDQNNEYLNNHETEKNRYNNELENIINLTDSLVEEDRSLHNQISGYKLVLEQKENALKDLILKRDEVNLKIKEKQQNLRIISDMEDNLEGYAHSVKSVIKSGKKNILSGVLGVVSQLIDVDKKHTIAIETALGGSVQNIVVENESSAKNAIRFLKNENLGRATFLPISSIKSYSLFANEIELQKGFVGIASNLVTCDVKIKPVIEFLLSRIVVANDIDTATMIANKYGYKFKIVTLDGQVINSGGSFTGGSKQKGISLISRKNEIISLESEIQSLIEQVESDNKKLNNQQEIVYNLKANYNSCQSNIQRINEDKIRFNIEEKRIVDLISQLDSNIVKLKQDLNSKDIYIKNIVSENIIDKENYEKNKIKLLEIFTKIESLKESSKTYKIEKENITDDLSMLQITLAETYKDKSTIDIFLDELLKRDITSENVVNRLKSEILDLENKNKQVNEIILNNTIFIKENEDIINSYDKEIEQLQENRKQLEFKTTTLRQNEQEIKNQKISLSSKEATLNEKKISQQKEYDDIILKLWDNYELTRSEAVNIAISLNDKQSSLQELNLIKLKIKNLGHINLASIDEYIEVKNRNDFLSSQINDITKSKKQLISLISELTQKMEDIFRDNFIKINQQFQSIFRLLFGGGNAELKITNPDNILESGIEIFVEPPGKIIKNLSALSGGEQSFIAIAIYFAILNVRPAPFCMLDEIEAALDDVNVDKYAQYLKKLTQNTQFILITHRRGTMEVADILYGVTMQDEGVSKLLTLDISNAK